MLVSKLDNEWLSLLKAQAAFQNFKDSMGEITLKPSVNLRTYVEASRLEREIQDLPLLKLEEAEYQFLQVTGRFDDDFLDYFKDTPLLEAEVVNNEEGDLIIKATGNMTDLILLETPLSAIVSEEYQVKAAISENITEATILGESVRRLQSRTDILRYYDDFRVILGGTRNRYSFDWQSTVTTLLMGEFKGLEKIIGCTNPLQCMAFGLPMAGYLNDAMWAPHWNRQDIYPTIDGSDDWEGARINYEGIDDVGQTLAKGFPEYFRFLFSIESTNEIAHILSHYPHEAFAFEWESITSDTGFLGLDIDYSRKMLTKS